MATIFGTHFANLRRALGVSLRYFCAQHDLDPGNISKLERGKLSPPRSTDKIRDYAFALELVEGSDEWIQFFDNAAASRGEFPEDLLLDENVEAKLPVLFRSLRGENISEEEFGELVEILRRS
ncbi:MAG: helix-turn-helix transcriptional regulator [Bacteroidetes bacterium]|nr:helix-turn-helix transcriptional regulator [Bacteroidota bacterium]